ncbi:DUF6152 family protein [Oryzifoliimicrobium ureilyticus]|uniref:DUF6152 family protein n=1 Tax=Oryzifoliimicrobium ureilyticus TaxID=3113724 RepID=UPI003075F944
MSLFARLSAFVVMLIGIPVTVAFAHHGFTGEYDVTRPVWLQGVVKTATFQYPHAIVELDVQAGEGRPERPADTGFLTVTPVNDPGYAGKTVRLEFPPIARFNSLEGQLNAGDNVSVIVYRNCEAPNQLRVQWIRLGDSTEVARSGRVQTEVQGCDH